LPAAKLLLNDGGDLLVDGAWVVLIDGYQHCFRPQ
jgi:hypothetical protein